jgi:hypothetical protein
LNVFIVLISLAVLTALWLVWISLRPKLFAQRVSRARREFARDRAILESQFFQMAATSGKPRGLAWTQCAFQNDIVLARDRANGELIGLVGVTIGFEAVKGGGMEEVEAVGNMRAASAVFSHNGREWTTQGRVIFNLEPHEVVERYRESLVAVGMASESGASPAANSRKY